MRFLLFQILASPLLVFAAFDTLQFSTNATKFTCPDMPFKCTPPAVCAHEFTVDRYYCCYPEDGECTGGAQSCDNNGKPSGSQQLCQKSDGSDFCCAKNREQCTEIENQINVCWSSSSNPVVNMSNEAMNKTYSSLSSASPSATAYSVKIADFSFTSSVPTTSSASSTASTPSSSSDSSQPKDTSGVSGGTIGGIVGGVVGGLALVGIAGFLLWRRHKAGKHAHEPVASTTPSETGNPYTDNAYHSAQPHISEAPVVEKHAHHVVEAPGTFGHELQELDGSRPAELDGNVPARRH